MVLCCVENGDEDANDAFRLDAVGDRGAVRIGEKGAGKVADASDNNGQVIAAIPEAVVGSLVTKDLQVGSVAFRGASVCNR